MLFLDAFERFACDKAAQRDSAIGKRSIIDFESNGLGSTQIKRFRSTLVQSKGSIDKILRIASIVRCVYCSYHLSYTPKLVKGKDLFSWLSADTLQGAISL